MRTLLLIIVFIVSLSCHGQTTTAADPTQEKRGLAQLLNQYYFLKDSNPWLARTTLQILLEQYPNDITGLSEMGYWYLNQKQPAQALPYFVKAFSLNQTNYLLALQIAYILADSQKVDQAIAYFRIATKSPDPVIRQKSLNALNSLQPPAPVQITSGYASVPSIAKPPTLALISQNTTTTADLFNLFYFLRTTNPSQAKTVLELILKREPNNVRAHTEMGYIMLAAQYKQEALAHFLKAFSFDKKNFALALQIGFLHSEQKQIKEAIEFLQYVIKNAADQNLVQKATTALKSLQPTLPDKKSYAEIPAITSTTTLPEPTIQVTTQEQPSITKPSERSLPTAPPPQVTANQPQPTFIKPEKVEAPQAPSVRLQRYYQLKDSDPKQARRILQTIIKQEPKNRKALLEAAYWELKYGNKPEGSALLKKAYALEPSIDIAMQIGYTEYDLGNKGEAKNYFQQGLESADSTVRRNAMKALTIINQSQVQAINVQTTKAEEKYVTARSTTDLLNQYFQLKKINVNSAKEKLLQYLQEKPNDSFALTEMGYLELGLNNQESAVNYFAKAYEINSKPEIALQLGYILASLKQNDKALAYFKKASVTPDSSIRKKSLAAINVMERKKTPVSLPEPKYNQSDVLLNTFYKVKKTDKLKARCILLAILEKDPCNIKVLKELGYLALELKDNAEAYCAFKRVYKQNCDYNIASQLGYVSDALNYKREAYYYFCRASKSPDKKLSLKSNIAMTNLGGWQTRVLCDPFFADLYTSPLYYGRFELGILPVIARAGFYIGKKRRFEIYASARGTRDTKSTGSAISPNIFEDNVAIYALGARARIFDKKQLFFFVEGGRAYDLIFRNRDKWRGDFRGGFLYFDRYGKKFTYEDCLKFPLKFTGDVYLDSIYYTRYKNNWITNFRLRPGFRLLEFRSLNIDVYYKGLYIVDTNRDFFNNLVEQGPGIVLFPYNRINFALRYETVRGHYINVGTSDTNPFGPHYNNKIFLAEFYVRF